MKLIINADDFAITEAVSKGILTGMDEGIITDTSVLTNSPHFSTAITMAKAAGLKAMGVHLNITFLKPILPVSQVNSLVDQSGNFYRKPFLIPHNYQLSQVEAELRAQIEKFLVTGLELNHLDTHHGFSILDQQMFELVIRLAKEYNVPMRKDDSLADNKLTELIDNQKAKTTDLLFGDPASKTVSREMVFKVIEKYAEQDLVIEIPGHPGYVDQEIRKLSSLSEERAADLSLFLDPELKWLIKQKNIELISYSQL